MNKPDISMMSLEEIEDYIKSLNRDDAVALMKLVDMIKYWNKISPLDKFSRGNPKQEEFICSEKDINIYLAGNRSGKTFAMTYFLAAVATGKFKSARHQPDPGRVLRVWFIAESYKVLNDTILKDLTGFLREDQYKLMKDGPVVSGIKIKGPNGAITEVLFKPSNIQKQAFESASLHYVFVDEGIDEKLFSALIIRLGGNRGQFFQAYTRLSYNYLVEMEKGRGRFKSLMDEGYVKFIHGRTRDNVFLTSPEHKLMEAALDGDKFERRARLEGIIDKPEGAVFDFQDIKIIGDIEYKWNLFDFEEIADFIDSDDVEWRLGHDYGLRDASVWHLDMIYRKTGTTYVVDEIYQKGMSIEQHGIQVYDMLQRWQVYDKVKICVADKSIKSDTVRRESTVSTSVLYQFMQLKTAEGIPCFPNQMSWRCKEKDKRNPQQSIQLVNTMLLKTNPNSMLEIGRPEPYLRFSPRCTQTVYELRKLEWREPSTNSNSSEVTKGDDHATATRRYLAMAQISDPSKFIMQNNDEATNKLGYLVGGIRGSYWNF